jgi:hypothetical protein
MKLEQVKQVADAVLYEGYILYPYRASAVKNQRRFNFGVLVPHAFSEKEGGSDAWTMRTECLIEGGEPTIDVRVRFLHLVSRDVYDAAAQYQLVPSLEVAGQVHHTWQEAVEREVIAENRSVRDLLQHPEKVGFGFQRSEAAELLNSDNGVAVGKIVRRQESVQGNIIIAADAKGSELTQISVEIQNTTPIETRRSTRDEALQHSLVSTHIILGARSGQFVSLLDPPDSITGIAATCTNLGAWPVLVGGQGERSMMLSSPIILYDYPQIASESSGDFFDGTEIDEMLALRVMTLTDDEKREMQQVDDRARQILQRTQSLPPEHWHKLHGAIRGLKPVEGT